MFKYEVFQGSPSRRVPHKINESFCSFLEIWEIIIMKTAIIVTTGSAAILLFWYFAYHMIIHALGVMLLNFVGSDFFLTVLDKVIGLMSILVMG